MAKSGNGQTSIVTFTPGRLFQVKLRGKRQAKGLISLYLDYYLGVTKTPEGKTKDQRKFEFLNLHIKDNPQSKEETQARKDKLKLALEIRKKREELLQTAVEGLPSPQRKKINFIDYFQDFYDNYKNKDVRLVKSCLKYFKEFVEVKHISPAEINEDFVEAFKSYLQSKLNGETPHNYFTKFKKLCKKATKDRLFLVNPAEEITINRPGGIKKEILSFNEIRLLSKTYCGNQNVKLAFLFCLNSGLRFIDIKNLKWKDVDFENDQLKIEQTKVKNTSSKPFVYIDLNNNIKAILKRLDKGKPQDNIFDLPSFSSTVKTLKRWVKKAEIEKNITWHSARHSFATNLLFVNTDIKTVSGLLGHSDLKHTQKYTHLVNELKRKAVDSLPDVEIKN